MVRVLGISGSPRGGKNTEALLRAALEAAEEAGAEVDLLRLSDYRIKPCDGCNVCLRERRCPLDEGDDMASVRERMLWADAIIFASPSYFGSVPGVLKNLMDRSRPLKMDGHRLGNKVASALSVSGLRHGGGEHVVEAVIRFALTHGMIIVGCLGDPLSQGWLPIASLQGDEGWRRAGDDRNAVEEARLLGRRIVEVAEALRRGGLLGS